MYVAGGVRLRPHSECVERDTVKSFSCLANTSVPRLPSLCTPSALASAMAPFGWLPGPPPVSVATEAAPAGEFVLAFVSGTNGRMRASPPCLDLSRPSPHSHHSAAASCLVRAVPGTDKAGIFRTNWNYQWHCVAS